ncbi:MAG: LD-carboxypeptidase [Clostridia bacterium]|nr:LD-carboxypeptidase [Clostridia bacterium]
MVKPHALRPGDTVCTVSPSLGCAGDPAVRWKYELGVQRLRELGLNVIAAPHSMKGSAYLAEHPQARAEDILWAFSNPDVRAVIANIGGSDSERILPFLDPEIIRHNPKIFCGYSDILTLHLYCHRLGLSTFYGPNLLTTIAEAAGFHTYSRHWFEKTFFDPSPIGEIPPSPDWSYSENNHTDPAYRKQYVSCSGYSLIQGSGRVSGPLFGGHTSLMDYEFPAIVPAAEDFRDIILFLEDIPEFFTVEHISRFFDWMGQNGFLQLLRGIIIGRLASPDDFTPQADAIRRIVGETYGLPRLPILCGLNFGHSSPQFILPYGARAALDADRLTFSIDDAGVLIR